MQNIGEAAAAVDAHIRMILLMQTFKVTGFNVEILKEKRALADSIVPNAKRTGGPPMLTNDLDRAVSGARLGRSLVVYG